jgi:hypothetical protein
MSISDNPHTMDSYQHNIHMTAENLRKGNNGRSAILILFEHSFHQRNTAEC